MEYNVFRSRFAKSYRHALSFAQKHVEETLPTSVRFHVYLNSSYDVDCDPEFQCFEEDSSDEVAFRLKHLTEEEALETIWRSGRVPQWINLSVIGETGEHTIISIESCGRFTADDSKLYEQPKEVAPFHILGPSQPPELKKERRFSIHLREECWSREDFERAKTYGAKIRFLELNGPALTDALLNDGLPFPNVQVIELNGTAITQLNAFASLSSLFYLRVSCGAVPFFDVGGASVFRELQSLTISNLPPSFRGTATVAALFPKLEEIRLTSEYNVKADAIGLPNLSHIAFKFPMPQPWLKTSTAAEELTFQFQQCSDEDILALFKGVDLQLRIVVLSGSPVTDKLLDFLAQFPLLKYMDVVDTQISSKALAAFAAGRPRLKYHPS